MAIQNTTLGKTISLKNDSGADIYPYRCVTGDAQGEVKYPTGTGKDFLGVTLKDLRYESGVTPDDKAVSVQIDGVVEIDCAGEIAVFDYVKVSGTEGKIASAGSLDSLSGAGTGALTPVVGIALEAGVDGSRISVLLRPLLV